MALGDISDPTPTCPLLCQYEVRPPSDLSQLSDEELMHMINVLAADCGLAPMKTIESSVPRREEAADPPLPNGGGTRRQHFRI
jgi:hypothetical protein